MEKIKNYKVGGLFSDYRLGFAHKQALKIAYEVICELKEEEKDEILLNIFKIFEEWKIKFGKPPKSNITSILDMIPGAREEGLSEKERIQKTKDLNPWECHPTATTPIALYNSLSLDQYKPLKDFQDSLNKKSYFSTHITATLIIMTHNSEGENQSPDCIVEAMWLANTVIEMQKRLIEIMRPAGEKEFNRKLQRRLKVSEKKKQTMERILQARQSCINKKSLSITEQ